MGGRQQALGAQSLGVQNVMVPACVPGHALKPGVQVLSVLRDMGPAVLHTESANPAALSEAEPPWAWTHCWHFGKCDGGLQADSGAQQPGHKQLLV